MRRAILIVLLVAGSVYALSPAAEGARVGDPQRYCRTSEGNGWSVKDVKQAIRCAAGKWEVDGGARKAIAVARCESSFHPRARNACCSGVFQQHRAYWRGRFRAYNPHRGFKLRPSVYNARTNIVISIRMARRVGWSPAWSCG